MSPPKWSNWGWVSITRSMYRSEGDRTFSSSPKTDLFAGPPSIKIFAPPGRTIRLLSPCPTSRKYIFNPSAFAWRATALQTKKLKPIKSEKINDERFIGKERRGGQAQ